MNLRIIEIRQIKMSKDIEVCELCSKKAVKEWWTHNVCSDHFYFVVFKEVIDHCKLINGLLPTKYEDYKYVPFKDHSLTCIIPECKFKSVNNNCFCSLHVADANRTWKELKLD